MPPVELVAAGFVSAIVFVGPLAHWVVLVRATLGLHGGDFLGPPRRRLLWFTPFAILLHPVPYFVVGTVVLTALAVVRLLSAGWLWFFAGFYTYALLMGLLVVPRLLKLRRKVRGVRAA
jgi:hypothetical protein